LNVFIVSSLTGGDLFHVGKLVLNVRAPGNVLLDNINFGIGSSTCSFLPEFKSVIEETLCNKTTWNSWLIISEKLISEV